METTTASARSGRSERKRVSIDESTLTARYEGILSLGDVSPHTAAGLSNRPTTIMMSSLGMQYAGDLSSSVSQHHLASGDRSSRRTMMAKKKSNRVLYRPFDGALVDPDRVPRYESLMELLKKQKEKEEREKEVQRQREREEAEARLHGTRISKASSSKGGKTTARSGQHSSTHRSGSEATTASGGVSRFGLYSVSGDGKTVVAADEEKKILKLYDNNELEKERADKMFEELQNEFNIEDPKERERLERRAFKARMKLVRAQGGNMVTSYLKEKVSAAARLFEKAVLVQDEMQVFLKEEEKDENTEAVQQAAEITEKKKRLLLLKDQQREKKWEQEEAERLKKLIFARPGWGDAERGPKAAVPFFDDEAHVTYEGPTSNGAAHGYGRAVVRRGNLRDYFFFPSNSHLLSKKNGDVYTGNFNFGRPHGFGILKSSNGDEYRGEWETSRRHGYGFANLGGGKSSFIGQWQNDQFHGLGIENQASKGYVFFGQYFQGRRHGLGLIYFPRHKQTHIGRWQYGRPNGTTIKSEKFGPYNDFVAVWEQWDLGKMLKEAPFDENLHTSDLQDNVMWICQQARSVASNVMKYLESGGMNTSGDSKKTRLPSIISPQNSPKSSALLSPTSSSSSPNKDLASEKRIPVEARDVRRFIPLVHAVDPVIEAAATAALDCAEVYRNKDGVYDLFMVKPAYFEHKRTIERVAVQRIAKFWRLCTLLNAASRSHLLAERRKQFELKRKKEETRKKEQMKAMTVIQEWKSPSSSEPETLTNSPGQKGKKGQIETMSPSSSPSSSMVFLRRACAAESRHMSTPSSPDAWWRSKLLQNADRKEEEGEEEGEQEE